ncbi:Cthe_2314 family HEPN domain-containing protein [Comamonas terrigena]|uniref:Cthe_2314 family HEPN domain-containing protein n=1 Tax=Comamonas terrigena TaxID=32013 RepID=UPI00244BA85D|nr:Cthe_2314 family HEPN domain-containing protein [Comamonas terrigena]MDH1291376.1 Cthe_2314 family HEPN domain-containing protein [Comamonas terrigena]
MTIDEFQQHQLIQEAFQDGVDIQNTLGLKLTDDLPEDTTLDELQFYIIRVGFATAHALGWVQQLHHAVHFMTEFKYGRKADDAGVNKSHHLLYNVENYLIRMVSIYDRCLQLTNSVFHLCISEELVNHGAVVSNLHVSRTDVPKLLKAVRKAIKDEEQERHKLIHRHSHIDPELRRIELFYMQSEAAWGSDHKVPFKSLVHMRGQLVKMYTSRRKAEFEAVNAELVNSMAPLFDGLLVEYRRQKVRLAKLV